MANKIQTAFQGKKNAVLIDDTNKVVAIITCNNSDSIDEKVELAIKEDLCVEKVEIEFKHNNMFDNQKPYYFTAHVTDEDGDTNKLNFELSVCAIY
jgi:hypothetical protein